MSIGWFSQPEFCGDGVCNDDEDCSSCSVDCGTCPSAVSPEGTGEGAGVSEIKKSFQLDKTFFSVEMKRGEHRQEQITLTNDGTEDLTINISITSLEKFIFPEQESFILKTGESKSITFDIYVSEKERADVYIGKINFNAKDLNRFVNVILDVKEKSPLFDIKTTVFKKYIPPGGKVIAEVFILNLGDLKNIDVELESKILDFDNKTYSSKKESFAINDSFKGKVFLETPKDIKIGDYVFYSKVSYKNISASSYDTFIIEKVSFLMWAIIVLILIVMIFLIAFLIIKKFQ